MRFHREIRLTLATIITVFAIMVAGAFAADVYVDDNATGPSYDGTAGDPYKRITDALADSGLVAGDTIYVAAGTYNVSTNNEAFPLTMIDGVSLRGEDRDTTIIDAEGKDYVSYHVIYCDNVNNFTIQNLTITGGNADWPSAPDCYGGGICCYSSSPALTDCTIDDNTSAYIGGGIYCYESSPTLTDCTLSVNTAETGGGISCMHSSSPTLTDCTISDNTAETGGGGGIYCQANSSPTLTNCTLSSNTASEGGGGIRCIFDSSPTLTDCTISDNTADSGDGGGIYCNESSPTLEGCTLSGNTAGSTGGGIYCYCSSPTLEGCTLSSNTATDGGGIYCLSGSPMLTSCTLSGNTASFYGGGIYCNDCSPTLNYSTLSGNTADDDGGGIYCDHSSPTITNCVIADNAAASGGGICLYMDSSAVALVNNVIAGNLAQGRGGGVYCYDSSEVIFAVCTISKNSADYGGGIFCCKSSPKVINSILWDDSPQEVFVDGWSFVEIIYSCVQGGWVGQGNIDEDPLFVPMSDAPYYLAHNGPQAADSPCIDAGAGWLDDYADFGMTSANTTCTDGRADADDDTDTLTGPIDMGYHYPQKYSGQEESSIGIASFSARPQGSSIVVSWETSTEIAIAGFVLFREITGTQDYVQRSDLIPAKGAPASGASYKFIDTGVEPGVSYNYWLVDIDTSGKWSVHGPATARVPLSVKPTGLPSAFANSSAKASDGGGYGGQVRNSSIGGR